MVKIKKTEMHENFFAKETVNKNKIRITDFPRRK